MSIDQHHPTNGSSTKHHHPINGGSTSSYQGICIILPIDHQRRIIVLSIEHQHNPTNESSTKNHRPINGVSTSSYQWDIIILSYSNIILPMDHHHPANGSSFFYQ
ncbi:hypothetical protein KY290_017787 [Solanum tuberosum]|uniref:Uncharacterized protein n=1 Tax=Solanum tuberosum TaxID=4113 RepID=A0ABQ7VCA8_SOLTU|nr:hypothetical protein KY290_017787 [Solanum tuberosum]